MNLGKKDKLFETMIDSIWCSLENLPVANKVAEQVICLPLYPTLDTTIVSAVCKLLRC